MCPILESFTHAVPLVPSTFWQNLGAASRQGSSRAYARQGEEGLALPHSFRYMYVRKIVPFGATFQEGIISTDVTWPEFSSAYTAHKLPIIPKKATTRWSNAK